METTTLVYGYGIQKEIISDNSLSKIFKISRLLVHDPTVQ